MTINGKDRLAAALGESYPRVWRGLGLEAKIARNLPDIQDKKRPRADAMSSHPYPTRRGREVVAVGGWRLGTQRSAAGQGWPALPEAE
jgi:hypothetical protein